MWLPFLNFNIVFFSVGFQNSHILKTEEIFKANVILYNYFDIIEGHFMQGAFMITAQQSRRLPSLSRILTKSHLGVITSLESHREMLSSCLEFHPES